MMPRRKKKEKYIHKWLREHPQVRLYLTREEHAELKEIAKESGMSIKELVLDALRNAGRLYNKGRVAGIRMALDIFIESPREFYDLAKDRAQERGIKDFEPMLFTVPCSVCGEPMVFHHQIPKSGVVRKVLREAFKLWYHPGCKKKGRTEIT